MSMRPAGLPEIPEQTVAVARAAFPQRILAMRVRDRLAGIFADEPFTAAFGVRGAPGLSPGVLGLVTVLQFHWSKDVVFGEDLSQVRRHRTPVVVSVFRDLARAALHRACWANIASGRRAHTRPEAVLTLHGTP
jgi:hypothetical protein